MKFTLPIAPQPQMRARHGRTRTGLSVTYKAPGQRQAEASLIGLLVPHRPETPLAGALSLTVTAYLPVPMSWSGRKIAQAETGVLKPAIKPDLDNLVKHLKDCLTAAGFWGDDKQVVDLVAAKRYNDGRGARWEVEIQELETKQPGGKVATPRRATPETPR